MNYLYQSPYPSHQELETFSEEFAVPLVQIQNWFKYQRNRDFYHDQKAVKNYKVRFLCNFLAKTNFSEKT